ncbi:MAG: excinuclease ABC subunit UvrA [Akkermansiaceae bacterium]|jgi:excinuclease ABC subunit A|nr:excinuclease ABC subunit UvrA [Akkermansiaceae bacterium]MDP4646413.1 excinuclease ABC subunit UvrA [Akkermansiaceae bacterium]MDP4721509.1 excinuclease ABC subunit UvrA [Akkermansiaceae bacterium]MDP4780016.1 excinuclease ABC subunit UvrA [Akkermansiaceae bacterium]MDP4897237.1 excinuclease ABC subunit UvrA [Akkermansiaceae bacterium]
MADILIRGARQHHLKNLTVAIPKGKLTVITGPSGSGKSSLAFDTLYAEGQRRYVESLSVYARQFLSQLEKPDVDSIEGLNPAIAIEQRVGGLSPRSTVASATEIYDYLRIIWAAAGVPHDPETGEAMTRMGPSEIITELAAQPEGSKLIILAAIPAEEIAEPERLLGDLQRQGFIRIRINGEIKEITETEIDPTSSPNIEIVIDRLVIRPGIDSRLADSIELALRICGAEAKVLLQKPSDADYRELTFQTSYRNPRTGEIFGDLSPRHFSFNTLEGACPDCEGLGCKTCSNLRLKKELQHVKVRNADFSPQSPTDHCSLITRHSLGIMQFCQLGISEAKAWIAFLKTSPPPISDLAAEVEKRLTFLQDVGLDYLSLDRSSGTLSGGEVQRIKLATQLGAGLSGVIYVLDEPSIGLHSSDTARLIAAITRLRDIGNTVVVVEHDEDIIRAADHLIDMGPGAGATGGEILAHGPPLTIQSPTGQWLRGEIPRFVPKKSKIQNPKSKITIHGAREHNLQNLTISIPLNQVTVISGPSGSGKSTLVNGILAKALAKHFHNSKEEPGSHDSITGLEHIEKFVLADQSSIGRSPRSNPATFIGAFDLIRDLFTKLPLAKQRGYKKARFSFNAKGGRCERCQGNGKLKIEMHFLPDAWTECPACLGKRFNRETLEITYKGKSIADILAMSISEAKAHFRPIPKLYRLLNTMEELGLGYLALGQAGNTLSGGESQRLKLALEISKPSSPHTLYLFDEPTTGLHFGDVEKLLKAIFKLRDAGHSIIIIEHHPDVIVTADHLITLGPGGGKNGGQLMKRM